MTHDDSIQIEGGSNIIVQNNTLTGAEQPIRIVAQLPLRDHRAKHVTGEHDEHIYPANRSQVTVTRGA